MADGNVHEASGPLTPPPVDEYASLEAAERAVRAWALDHGYNLTRCKLVMDKRKPPTARRRDLRCAKGGVKRGEGVKRKTGTRMVECPFEVRLRRTELETWEVLIHHAIHTCDASDPAAFAQYRKPTEPQKDQIRSLHSSGVAPRFILAQILEQQPNTLLSLRDIYNEVARMRKERLSGLSPIETLVMELRDSDNWALTYRTDDKGHVNFLFFAPHEAIELAQQSPDVIFIDATYQTNRYNMPLIHFMAVTAIGTTTSIGMCFVANEKEQMYL